jgi:hypothetical protein
MATTKICSGVSGVPGVARDVQRRRRRDAVEAAERRGADPPLIARGGVDEVEQDQRHRQGDDAHVDVADPAVEHDVAQRGGGQRRHQQRLGIA